MSYSQAIEEQARLSKFMRGGGKCTASVRLMSDGVDERREETARLIESLIFSTLEGATPFYWSPEMCDVLGSIASTMPAWTLHRRDLLVEQGFMHFAKPLPLPGRFNEDWQAPLSAIAWRPTLPTDAYGDQDDLYVSLFIKLPEYPPVPFIAIPFVEGQDIRGWMNDVGTEDDGFPDRPIVETALCYIGAALALVRQQIITTPSERPERSIRKRLPDDWQGEPMVRVVQLRRISANHGAGSDAVEWSHRWVVSGHWRQQACGPNYSERRPVYVLPFVKGPGDKPLKAQAERVFAVVR
jgi:hypothetical protein